MQILIRTEIFFKRNTNEVSNVQVWQTHNGFERFGICSEWKMMTFQMLLYKLKMTRTWASKLLSLYLFESDASYFLMRVKQRKNILT